MRHLPIVLAALLSCTAASATELVRVRVSQFDGSEPAVLSSTSHPQLFVLDPSIAFAELVATNPADPRKEDHGPATWLPVMTASEFFLVEDGQIELRITPVAGVPVAFGWLHFRAETVERNSFQVFWLHGTRPPDLDPPALIDLSPASTSTRLLVAPASDEITAFRWLAGASFIGSAPAGFSGVDLVVSAPLCEAAPREECDAATQSRLSIERRLDDASIEWRWRARDAGFDELGSLDDAPLFALCLYDARGLVLATAVGPDRCDGESCWGQRPRGFRFRSDLEERPGIGKLRLRETRRGVAGSLEAGFPGVQGLPGTRVPITTPPFPVAVGDVRAQLVRSDDGACIDAGFPLPARIHTDLRFEDSLR